MSSAREPQSRFYDGWLYANFTDRLLTGVHAIVADRVPAGTQVLDACCGTGALALRLARKCAAVTGVDLSPRMVQYAEAVRNRRGVANVTFVVGDAGRLDEFAPGAFDVATVVMAIHEMPPALRAPVLRELGRVARRVFAVDFAAPQPWNLPGVRNRLVEIAAGSEHARRFREFVRGAGLVALAAEAGLEIDSTRIIDGGALALVWMGRS